MLRLILRDYLSFKNDFLQMLGFFNIIILLMGSPWITFYIAMIITMLFCLFLYDKKVAINRFLISLPVKKAHIIRSRYISFLLFSLCLSILQTVLDYLLTLLQTDYHFTYDWKTFIILICLTALIGAISIPIFYGFRSFITTITIMSILSVIGLFLSTDALVEILGMQNEIIFTELDPGYLLLVEKHIHFMPYLTLILISFAIFYLSMKVSEFLFKLNDQ